MERIFSFQWNFRNIIFVRYNLCKNWKFSDFKTYYGTLKVK